MAHPLGVDAQPEIDFHILSFEGPDPYARAGGIASRLSGLAQALAQEGFEAHLWFIGDPDLPGHETIGRLSLHRWCQWISRYHRGGVYDGEGGKRNDYSASLPPFLLREQLRPRLAHPDRRAVILAEEWQTASALLHIDALLRVAGLRERVAILWNANNVFGFEQVDWRRLAAGARITTVSRYMRHLMWPLGVDPLVIPNGVPDDYLQPAAQASLAALRRMLRDRLVLTKVARWDPDKRWLLAVDIVAELKRLGARPLLIARGGVEEHGTEVLARARAAGLHVVERAIPRPSEEDLLCGLAGLEEADVVSLRSHLTPPLLRLLFRGSAAVLANSGREPFGLVGLETMAAGGVACVGGTGEDYAVPGWNSLLLQTEDPREFPTLFRRLLSNPADERAVRARAIATARCYTWRRVIRRDLLPRVFQMVDDGRAAVARASSYRRRAEPRKLAVASVAAQRGRGELSGV